MNYFDTYVLTNVRNYSSFIMFYNWTIITEYIVIEFAIFSAKFMHMYVWNSRPNILHWNVH